MGLEQQRRQPASEQEKHETVELSRPYVMFLVSCAAGCVVVPVILITVAVVTLPNWLSTAFLGLMAMLAVVPLTEPGPWAKAFARDMCAPQAVSLSHMHAAQSFAMLTYDYSEFECTNNLQPSEEGVNACCRVQCAHCTSL
jgi:hypothetical protein